MWENIVEPHMTVERLRIACWTTEATNTHSEYLIINALPLLKWLHERASMLHYSYIACLVKHYSRHCLFDLVNKWLIINAKWLRNLPPFCHITWKIKWDILIAVSLLSCCLPVVVVHDNTCLCPAHEDRLGRRRVAHSWTRHKAGVIDQLCASFALPPGG